MKSQTLKITIWMIILDSLPKKKPSFLTIGNWSSWIRVISPGTRWRWGLLMAYAMRRWLVGWWWVGWVGFLQRFCCWYLLIFFGSPTIIFFDGGWGEKNTIQKKPLIFFWEWWLIFRVKLCLDKWVAIWSSCFLRSSWNCQLDGTNPTSWDESHVDLGILASLSLFISMDRNGWVGKPDYVETSPDWRLSMKPQKTSWLIARLIALHVSQMQRFNSKKNDTTRLLVLRGNSSVTDPKEFCLVINVKVGKIWSDFMHHDWCCGSDWTGF